MGGTQAHWAATYAAGPVERRSWHRDHLEVSLSLIRRVTAPDDALIDVGGGASTLVDDLLDLGYTRLTVLDLSAAALDLARLRLGERAGAVTWLEGDVTEADLPEHAYALWHDRAALHFLVDDAVRRSYVRVASRAVAPGGHLVIATFALDGPDHCSGLPVQRYDAAGLERLFAPAFSLRDSARELHTTPAGKQQSFTYALLRREAT